MSKKMIPFAALAFSVVFSQATMAASVIQKWAVTDAQEVGQDHGLWTNGLAASAGPGFADDKKRHSFNSGSMLTEYADNTAHLMATATNQNGRTATIDIKFSGYLDDYAINKTVGGPVLPSWYYYSTIDAGSTITINSIIYYIGMVDFANPNRIGESPILQIGTGANDKNGAFGASTWIDVFSDPSRQNKLFDHRHWDLNMNLTAVPTPPSEVPLPAAVWLLGSALFGFVGMRRKAKQA